MLLKQIETIILTDGAKQESYEVGGTTIVYEWATVAAEGSLSFSGESVDKAVSKLLALGFAVRENDENGRGKITSTTAGKRVLAMQPGQPVSMQHVADCYPGVIQSISPTGHEIVVQGVQHRANPDTVNEMGHQNWIVELDKPQGGLRKFTRRQRVRNGERQTYYASPGSTHPFLSFGGARYYYCWEF